MISLNGTSSVKALVIFPLSITASWLHFVTLPEFPYIHYPLSTYFLHIFPPQSVLWASIDMVGILWPYVLPIWTLTDYFAYIKCFWLGPGVCAEGDIRSCLNTLQFLNRKKQNLKTVQCVLTHFACLWTIYRKFEQLALQLGRVLEIIQSTWLWLWYLVLQLDVGSQVIGRKDMTSSIFDIWGEVSTYMLYSMLTCAWMSNDPYLKLGRSPKKNITHVILDIVRHVSCCHLKYCIISWQVFHKRKARPGAMMRGMVDMPESGNREHKDFVRLYGLISNQ